MSFFGFARFLLLSESFELTSLLVYTFFLASLLLNSLLLTFLLLRALLLPFASFQRLLLSYFPLSGKLGFLRALLLSRLAFLLSPLFFLHFSSSLTIKLTLLVSFLLSSLRISFLFARGSFKRSHSCSGWRCTWRPVALD
jgi:hypothetical protein